jgi:hypothetical protein
MPKPTGADFYFFLGFYFLIFPLFNCIELELLLNLHSAGSL